MDAEIRRLTYASKPPMNRLPPGLVSLFGEYPPRGQRSDGAAAIPGSTASPTPTHALLEARVAELEATLAAAELRHTTAARDAAAAEAEQHRAFDEQKAMLESEWATRTQASLAAFEQARAEYFAQAEAAVVRLSLTIARRILHREAQVDPLLLRGAVRVALEDAQGGTTCVLEVAQSEQALWQKWLASEGRPVEVRGLEDVPSGHCRLLLGMSRADLSTEAQLAEIERGFFDLLRKPAGARGPEPA